VHITTCHRFSKWGPRTSRWWKNSRI